MAAPPAFESITLLQNCPLDESFPFVEVSELHDAVRAAKGREGCSGIL